MNVPPESFRKFSKALITNTSPEGDVPAMSLKMSFLHFMKHSFSKNNIKGCDQCAFINKLLLDHLSKDCEIMRRNERCYFHEVADHIKVCRHMLLKGSHPSEGCRVCSKNNITLSYRQKFEHAASCTNKECSTTCSKWKLFIQHLKSCPGCWVCLDEDSVNSVYLIEHQKATFNKPPQYMPSTEIPSNQSTPRQPIPNEYPQNYSQMNMGMKRESPYPIPPRNTIPSKQRQIPSNYDPVRPTHQTYPPQQNTINPNPYHRNSFTEQPIPPSVQSTSQYTNNPRTIHTSPRVATPPASQPTSYDGIAIPQFRPDPTSMYSSHTQKPQPQPQPPQKPQPQQQPQSTQTTTSLYPSNQKTVITPIPTSSSTSSVSKAYIPDSVFLDSSLHIQHEPSESHTPLNIRGELNPTVTTIRARDIMNNHAKFSFAERFEPELERVTENWIRDVLVESIQLVKKRNGMSTVAGVKLEPQSKITQYIRNQNLREITPMDRKNNATLDKLVNDHTMFNVISVDDIRNLVKYQQSASTTLMQHNGIV